MSRAVGKEQCHELNDVLRKSRLSRFLNPIHVVSKYRSKIRPTILNLQYAVLTILRNFLDIKKSLRNRNGILKNISTCSCSKNKSCDAVPERAPGNKYFPAAGSETIFLSPI